MDNRNPPQTDLETADSTFDEHPSSVSRQSFAHPLAYELVGLQRVVNSIRLYGLEHNRSREQSEELLKRIRPLLDEIGAVPLQVTDGALLFGETRIIEEGERGGIVDELFRDGIRFLTLSAGIDVDEFLNLLAILGTNFHLPQHQEDTLQGLLWATDLPHVSYEAVQGIEEAVEDSADAGRGAHVDFDEVCGALVGRTPNPQGMPSLARGAAEAVDKLDIVAGEGDMEWLPTAPDLPIWEDDGASIPELLAAALGGAEAGGGPALAPVDQEVTDVGSMADDEEVPGEPMPAGDLSTSMGPSLLHAQYAGQGSQAGISSVDTIDLVDGRANELGISPDELLQMWEEADSDSMSTLLDRCISILIHTALFDAPGADLESAAPLVEVAMEEAASIGLVSRYRSTVELLAGIVEAEEGFAEALTAKRLLDNLLRIDLLLAFASSVDHEDSGAARDIQRILEIGGHQLIKGILTHIPQVEDDAFRRFLLQRLVLTLEGDPRPLTKDLRRMEPVQMRIRLELLARMDSYVARDMLTSLLEHPDAAVRIAAVELIPSGHLRFVWKRLAQRLADDGEPEVRAEIIKRMEADKLPALAPLLRRMATADSFHRRAPEEKKLALDVLARSGGDEGVRTLITLMNAKSSLIHPRHVETRRFAADALGRCSSPRAHAALQKASRSWDPGLRRAAKEALAGGRPH